MIIKTVTQIGNPLIRTKIKKVTDFKLKKVKTVIKNLVDSMHYYDLVGMAAPQIGENMRVFVSEIRVTKIRKEKNKKNADKLRIYINPVIVWFSKKEVKGYEGCGSIAESNLFGIVKRPQSVIVEALDEKGNKFTLKADNLLARVIQHELDHLNGIVFTDKADPKSFMSKDEYIKKFR